MSPEDTHKPIRIYIGGLILGINTLYMLFYFFKLLAVVGNELKVHVDSLNVCRVEASVIVAWKSTVK